MFTIQLQDQVDIWKQLCEFYLEPQAQIIDYTYGTGATWGNVKEGTYCITKTDAVPTAEDVIKTFKGKMCSPKRTSHIRIGSPQERHIEKRQILCSHEAAPRGSKSGTQGIDNSCHHLPASYQLEAWGKRGGIMGIAKKQSPIASTMCSAALRAIVPYQLSLAVCEAAERDLAAMKNMSLAFATGSGGLG